MEHLEDKAEILRRLEGQKALHIYEIGDLDPFFWPHCRFYGGEEGSVALVYSGVEPATLLAFGEGRGIELLIAELLPRLPNEVYAHLSPQLAEVVCQQYELVSRGEFQKMRLVELPPPSPAEDQCVVLGAADLQEVRSFYDEAYPGNYFDPRMLDLDCYVGVRLEGRLAALAGVHVYSRDYGAAALGNIATASWARRQGWARVCTGRLCRQLQKSVDCIGLNVKKDNDAAIGCYELLGFVREADYLEVRLRRASV